MMTTSDLFLDSAFAIALAIRTDQYHERAAALANEVRDRRGSFVTTRAVILEIGNMLSATPIRSEGVRLIASLHNDDRVEIVDISSENFDLGFRLFRSHTDKDRGLVDCISFVVMQERGITEVLTVDRHFAQAGFRALLLEET